MKRYQLPTYKFPHEGQWMIFDELELQELEKTNPDKYQYWDNFIYDTQQAPIRNFLPHGKSNTTIYKNDGLSLSNDWQHDLVLVTAPNQTGKTTIGIGYVIFHGAIPTDPTWSCFTKHGIEYHPWTGPKIVIAASWSWDSVVDLWRAYRYWLPRKELGKYAPQWGHWEGEKGRQQEMNFGAKIAKEIELKCGTRIIFLCYGQSQTHWEGKQCDIGHLDEQCPEDKFDGLTARQLTRGKYTPIIMTLTGHTIPGRPDTGAHGWIKQNLIDRGITKGKKFKEYHIRMEDVPDAIISPEQKKRARIQWVVEPERMHNLKKIREGEARFYGGWETGGGLVISEWYPDIHLIPRFDVSLFKPSYFRMIDHGQDPCAALLVAKMPWGDFVFMREYYEFGNSIETNAANIVEKLTGNTRRVIDEWDEAGQTWKSWEEIESGLKLEASELDGRSFNSPAPESRRTMGSLYNQFGCNCSPACTDQDRTTIPLLKELFALDPKRKHISTHIGKKWDGPLAKYGAPKAYVFSDLDNFIMEIQQWIEDPRTGKPKGKCHLMDGAKYLAARERSYSGDFYGRTEDEN